MADATITSAGMRLIKLLAGRPPQAVLDLMDEIGVTRTAVTEQLHDLMEAGYVERIIEHLSGRGRPRHRYSATPAALVLLFASNQQLVVPAIWKAIHDAGGDKLTQKVLHSVSNALLEHYRARITATEPKQRLAQYMRILEEEGGLVDLRVKDGQITLTKRTCPFISMFEDERNVCAIDLELMAAIAGCPVRQISCRHNGDPCCRFEADPRRKKVKHARSAGTK
jgi:DeoR family transcriptional regulator, suf operon transcriptional repressor